MARDGARERGEVDVGHLPEADDVHRARRPARGEVVDPEDVVVARREDGAGDLDLHPRLVEVGDPVARGERAAHGARDERVDLPLLVVVLRRQGEPQREALAIGTLMNARGLMELIILNIGLERGILEPTLFTIMVLMAIVTTLMATPIFERVYRRQPASVPRGLAQESG